MAFAFVALAACGIVYANEKVCSDTDRDECWNLSSPSFPPLVGTTRLHEDSRQIVWDLTMAPGERYPPHEHMFDYSFHVLSGSTLAVFSGEDGSHMFSFDAVEGETKAFRRRGSKLHDISGVIPPFDAVHGVQNIGNTTYREILVESKPCVVDVEHAAVRRLVVFFADDRGTRLPVSNAAATDTLRNHAVSFGACVNSDGQASWGIGATHATVLTFKDRMDGEHAVTNLEYDAFVEQLESGLAVNRSSIVFDYSPHVLVSAPTVVSEPLFFHVMLVKLKVDAPVGQHVSAIMALHQKADEVLGFEWGPVANAFNKESLAGGFEFVFMAAFENVSSWEAWADSDAYRDLADKLSQSAAAVAVINFVNSTA